MRTVLAVFLSVGIWVLFTRIGGFLLVQLEILRSDNSRDFVEFTVAVGCSVLGVYLAKLASEAWIKSYSRQIVAIPFGLIVLVNLYLEFVAGWGMPTPITSTVASLGVLGAAYALFWKHSDDETAPISGAQLQNQSEFNDQIAELDQAERDIMEKLEQADVDGELNDEIEDEDSLEDDPLGVSQKERLASDLAKELDDWPENKTELAHRFIKCIVLRESEEDAKTMARQFSPDQFRFLQAHISEVLRLYGKG